MSKAKEAKAMTNKKDIEVWYGELDRFGYTLRAVGRTKKETISALMDEYVEWFKNWGNDGLDPNFVDRDEEYHYKDGKWFDWEGIEVNRDEVTTYADAAREDICLWQGVLGKAFEL